MVNKKVMIIGMHRSGTSMLAHMLQSMGVYMGASFLKPDKNNKFGYWEDKEFLKINKKILAACGGDWQTNGISRKTIINSGAAFYPEISELVEARRTLPVWGFKDPRNSLLAPIYHAVMPDLLCIYIQRDMDAIIKSLLVAHGGNYRQWRNLTRYYRNHIKSFLSSENPVTLLLHYEDFKDPALAGIQIDLLSKFLGIKVNQAKAMDIIL